MNKLASLNQTLHVPDKCSKKLIKNCTVFPNFPVIDKQDLIRSWLWKKGSAYQPHFMLRPNRVFNRI